MSQSSCDILPNTTCTDQPARVWFVCSESSTTIQCVQCRPSVMATELVEPPPPAPPMNEEELQGLKTRLCQAVLSFQSAMHSTESGSLAQVRITPRLP
jgi:hypothetical protein